METRMKSLESPQLMQWYHVNINIMVLTNVGLWSKVLVLGEAGWRDMQDFSVLSVRLFYKSKIIPKFNIYF